MKKNTTEIIDTYLNEDKKINESILMPNETNIKPGEYNSLSAGLKRIQYRLEKANTPQKYVDAFSVVQQLMERFPLKSKVIWQTVASMYQIRFTTINVSGEITEQE
jgi:hypothetical protein